MKKLFTLFAAVLFAGSMMAAEVEIANATFNGKNATYTAGWTTTGTGVSRTDCVVIGKDENITSPSIDLSAYKSISITFKARRYGSLSGSKATISVAYGGAELGTIDVTSSSVGDVSGSIDYNVPDGLAASSFVFTCTNATSAGSTHGAGIGAITITGNTGGESVAANFCLTEVGHLMEATPAQDSYVLLSIGSKGGKTIVRIDQDGEKNTAMFDYLQVTGLTQTGEDVAEGGVAAMAVEFDTPALTNDSMTLEILWSTVNWPGRWMVQNLRVAVAECEYAVIPKAPLVPKTCAEVYSMAKDDEVLLNDVTVTFANGKNVWVKDATGSMLVYLPANGSFVAGDVLSGVEGVVDIYNGVTEVKLNAAQVEAITATAGEAPAPEELTAVATTDMNKYIVLKNLAVEGEFVEGTASNITLTLADESTIVLRSNFKNAYAFDAAKTYNITAVVTIYQSNPQLYFISAEEYVEPVVPADRRINAYGLNVVANGDDYAFSYYANIAGEEANLLFYKDGVLKGRVAVDAPKQGVNDVTLAKSEIPEGTGLTWAVELKANPVTEFACVHTATAMFGRGQAVINAIPESDYFGYIYYTNRTGSATGGLYVYNPDYSLINTDGAYKLGETEATWGSQKFSIDATGMLWLPDYTDGGHSGVYIVDPANLNTCSQFYQGTRNATSGLWTNGGVEVGGSTPSAYIHGEGADAKLYVIEEDMTGYKNGLLRFDVGQSDGSILHQWGTAPSKKIALADNTGGVFSIGVTDKAIWLCQNRSKGANAAGAYSLMAYSHDGIRKYASTDATFINGSLGGGLVIDKEGLIYIPDGDKNILVLKPTYAADTTVTLEKVATIDCGYSMISSMSFDYAGNLVASVSNSGAYSNSASMLMAVFAIPTDKNEIIVPAKKALVVEGTDPNPSTAIEDIYVLEVQKVIRNGQVLIIKDGKTYNMMGQIVE